MYHLGLTHSCKQLLGSRLPSQLYHAPSKLATGVRSQVKALNKTSVGRIKSGNNNIIFGYRVIPVFIQKIKIKTVMQA